MTNEEIIESLERLTNIVEMHVTALESIDVILGIHQDRLDAHHKRLTRLVDAHGT